MQEHVQLLQYNPMKLDGQLTGSNEIVLKTLLFGFVLCILAAIFANGRANPNS
jgi:hypothetical protein